MFGDGGEACHPVCSVRTAREDPRRQAIDLQAELNIQPPVGDEGQPCPNQQSEIEPKVWRRLVRDIDSVLRQQIQKMQQQ